MLAEPVDGKEKTPDHFLIERVTDMFSEISFRTARHYHGTQKEPPGTVVKDDSTRSNSFLSEDRFRSTHFADSDHPDGIVS